MHYKGLKTLADYQSIVDKLRMYVAGGEKNNDESIEFAARQYVTFCQEANERLHRCADYLRRGLPGEAIALSESPPDLLEMVAALDMPELPAFEQICARHGWTLPPQLDLATAAAINEIYSHVADAETLLSQHRLLALAAAPLGARLLVLRLLEQQHPGVGFWKQDVATFERAYVDELRARVAQAGRASDAKGLETCAAEIAGTPWTAGPPTDLQTFIRDNLQKLRRADATRQLTELLPAIHSAYGAMSLSECQKLLTQWRYIAESADLAVPPAMNEQVQPVAAWIAEQERQRERQAAFEEACAALQQGLDTEAGAPKLEALHRAAVQYGGDLPEDLDARYRNRMRDLAAAESHRRRMRYAAIAVAAVVVIASGIVVTVEVLRSRDIGHWEAALRQADHDLLSTGNRTEAKSVLANLKTTDAGILHDGAIVPLVSRLQTDLRNDQQRRTQFAGLMSRTREAGLAAPDTIDLDAAARLARTPSEHTAVEQWRNAIKRFSTTMRVKTDMRFKAAAAALRTAIQERLTRQSLRAGDNAFSLRVDKFRRQVAALAARPGVDPALAGAQARRLFKMLDKRRGWIVGENGRKRALAEVLRATGSVGAHYRALAAYVKRYPTAHYAAAFRQAMELKPEDEATQAWGRIVGGWHGRMNPSGKRDALARIAVVKAFNKRLPGSAWASDASLYAGYLHRYVVAQGAKGPLLRTLAGLLRNPLIRDLKTLRDTNGQRYYIYGNPHISRDQMGLHFNAITKPNVKKPQAIGLASGDSLLSRKPALSGQAVFARAAQRLMRGKLGDHWETLTMQVLALAQKQKMNTMLKGLLVEHLLEINADTLYPMYTSTNLQVALAALRGLKLDDVNWLSPTKTPPSTLKYNIRQILGRIPPMTRLERNVEADVRQWLASADFQIYGEAVAMRAGGRWTLRGAYKPADGQMAYCDTLAGPPIAVGRFTRGKWRLNQQKFGASPDGTLVFIGDKIPKG